MAFARLAKLIVGVALLARPPLTAGQGAPTPEASSTGFDTPPPGTPPPQQQEQSSSEEREEEGGNGEEDADFSSYPDICNQAGYDADYEVYLR